MLPKYRIFFSWHDCKGSEINSGFSYFSCYCKNDKNKAKAFCFLGERFPPYLGVLQYWFPRGAGKPGGAWSAVPTRVSPALPVRAEAPDLRVKRRRSGKEASAGRRRGRRAPEPAGRELPGASQPHSPRSWCQVLRGGVGARGGDGWRLSSPGSRNANSARNGEATGGGGEALRLPQPLRCRRDFASRQRELRVRPPPRSPPGTSSAKTFGPGHKSICVSVAPLGEGPRAAGK